VPIGTCFLHRLFVVIIACEFYHLLTANPSFWRVNTLLSDKSNRILLEPCFIAEGYAILHRISLQIGHIEKRSTVVTSSFMYKPLLSFPYCLAKKVGLRTLRFRYIWVDAPTHVPLTCEQLDRISSNLARTVWNWGHPNVLLNFLH
jgi:hypothetical protein